MKNSGAGPRIAVVGASSLIGEALLEELRLRKFQHGALHALDDTRDLGRPARDEDGEIKIGDVAAFDFSSVDLAFFCARTAVSQRYAETAAAHAWVIDASSAHRHRAEVPLIVADVNGATLTGPAKKGLIALPGSASVALATVLAPLHALAGLERVEVATYQAVSGSGRAAMEGLAAETVDLLGGRKTKKYSFGKQIAFNVIPQVDAIDADGVSLEERRLLEETRRVLGLPHLAINATAVRVPVFFGHSFAVHVSFERELTVNGAAELLQRSSGLGLIEAGSAQQFPTPATEALAPDRVYVGRLRRDLTRDRSLNFWVVADNVRKCAAYNAFSVAQILVNRSL
ncbi:MAG: aspartate-semialdehyde dehydrogenase [Steroidobacteraceae bacterium]|jgi:aspartate-semialdehyde dehydrogenase